MTAAPPTANWTGLLAGAVAHDINNFVQGVSSARALAGAPGATSAEASETEAIIEDDLEQLRKLGGRLRALASAAGRQASTRLAEACADACAEVDLPLGQMRGEAVPADLCVVGPAAALTTAIASLLEHARAASPPDAAVSLTIRGAQPVDAPAAGKAARPSAGAAVMVEIAAPQARELGTIAKERLDLVLAGPLPELRGDARLILAGAVADALGGAVHLASDAKAGLTLTLHLVAC